MNRLLILKLIFTFSIEAANPSLKRRLDIAPCRHNGTINWGCASMSMTNSVCIMIVSSLFTSCSQIVVLDISLGWCRQRFSHWVLMHCKAAALAFLRQRFATDLEPQFPLAVNLPNGIGPIAPPVVCHSYFASHRRTSPANNDADRSIPRDESNTIVRINI